MNAKTGIDKALLTVAAVFWLIAGAYASNGNWQSAAAFACGAVAALMARLI